MKIQVIAVGHRMPNWVDIAWHEYAKRLPSDWPVDLLELKPETRQGRTVAQAMEQEGRKMIEAIAQRTTPHSRIIVLDERGSHWTTQQFSEQLGRLHQDAMPAIFVIGGADGLSKEVKATAHMTLQLSAMTLPHAMVRVLLIEQIYRVWSLLHQHPYHRE